MPKVLRDYEVYLVYIDPDRCDSCEQCLIMCPTDVFEMPHKAIAAGRRAAISIDQYLGGDGKIEFGIRNAEGGKGNSECGLRPLRAVGSIYEPEAVGAIGAYAPEGSNGSGKTELGIGNAACDKLSRVEVGINESGNGYDGGRESGFAELKRVEVPSLPFSERHVGFREVQLCFTDEQVKQETHRCLQCDLEICLAKAQKGS